MAFSLFFKLAFKCVHHFAWPLLALGYPLCASVQAIETDSYAETRDLISYWILLSLIYLFEYAFIRILLWFQMWPYIKLMIIFWLVVPDFGRASYVYKNLIRFMKPQILTCSLRNYWRKLFVEKENFLLQAERYMKENGTEALEKLIASKITMYKPDAEATNAVRATDNKEMQQTTNGKILRIAHEGIQVSEVIEKKEIAASKQTNGKKLQTEQDGTKVLEVVEKKEIATSKQDVPVMPIITVPNQNASSAIVETTIARKDIIGGEICQSSASAHKEVQKEWTCALCQVTTSSEITLNSHLKGRKHKNTCEALKAQKQSTHQELKISKWKEVLKLENATDQQNSKANNGLKGTLVMDQKVQKPHQNLSELGRMKSSKFKCVVCDVILECESSVASHFSGKKHLAKIQS